MSAEGIGARTRQLAIIGASADLATEAQMAAAADLGRKAAERGLVCVVGGDDGVMGAAVRAAKNAGGATLGVLPREKRLSDPGQFDAVVDTGLTWVQFSDAMLRSCCAAVVIGGGAGTLGELTIAYLTQLPTVFLGDAEDGLARRYGDTGLDERNLMTLPVCSSATEALDTVFAASSVDFDAVREQADGLHFASYPFGDESSYLEAAQLYRSAMVGLRDVAARKLLAARHEDALGDHFYYHVEDFLQAAAHYGKARGHLTEEPRDGGFSRYLEAITLESIAFGLAGLGEHALASTVASESATRYEAGVDVAAEQEHPHLLHSAAGLRGDAAFYAAVTKARAGDPQGARAALATARAEYGEALDHHPAWASGATSDTYGRAIEPVEKLARELDDLEIDSG